MESDVSPFNAWPVILFTTLQQAGAKPTGEINYSAPLTLCAHARIRQCPSLVKTELPPPLPRLALTTLDLFVLLFFGLKSPLGKPPGSRWGTDVSAIGRRFPVRGGIAATASRDAAALRAPWLHPGPGQTQAPSTAWQLIPTGVPCDVPAVSPLLLTCSPLCRSPLPPGPSRIPQDASRREHMSPRCTASPGSPGCSWGLWPHRVPSIPAVSPRSPLFLGGVPWSPSAPSCRQHPSRRADSLGTPSAELLLSWACGMGREIERAKLQRTQPKNTASLSLLSSLQRGGELRQQGPAGALGNPCPAVGMLGVTNGALWGHRAPWPHLWGRLALGIVPSPQHEAPEWLGHRRGWGSSPPKDTGKGVCWLGEEP